jgi:DNA-binding NarL/FixJ family response regulator
VKILLVDDHTLVLRGIAHVLRDCVPGAEVTEASNTEQALEALQAEPHDIALVDIRLPGRDGLDLLREVRATWPQTPVIILTSFDSAEYVRRALADGAAGYLLKDSSPEDLAQAIRVALGGAGNVLSPRAVRNLFNHPGQIETDRAEHPRVRDSGLTRREWDILDLLAEGHPNREISKRLFLSEKTVKAHLAAVFRKLGVTNRTQAAMAAVAMGAHAGPSNGPGPELWQGHRRRAEEN